MLQLAPRALHDEIRRWKDVYFPLFQQGHLLVEGGIADQPARWLEAMLFLDDLHGRTERRLLEPDKAEEGA